MTRNRLRSGAGLGTSRVGLVRDFTPGDHASVEAALADLEVYGSLPGLRIVAGARRYEPLDPDLRAQGISERRTLDFESPYGCSKGAADPYVLDRARSSGPRQFGTEDQGWVAHFLLRALKGQPLTLSGDGLLGICRELGVDTRAAPPRALGGME